MKIIKRLNGFSGSEVFLIENNNLIFVRKINNIDRNYERLYLLKSLGFPVPKIIHKENNLLDIEYIPSLDMKTYLLHNPINELLSFLTDIFLKFSDTTEIKDYFPVYEERLHCIDFSYLPFTIDQLLKKLPRNLPKSLYFGDLTLENILYGNDEKFYLIDGATTEYDSYIFDIAKLRQDLRCAWFLRNNKNVIQSKLLKIENNILTRFPLANNDYLLILMLLRVYNHAENNSFEQKFLLQEIKRLWK